MIVTIIIIIIIIVVVSIIIIIMIIISSSSLRTCDGSAWSWLSLRCSSAIIGPSAPAQPPPSDASRL
jgi:hypothetical protein